MLVGREEERGQIDRLLHAARAGTSGALVIQGEAGVGKSAILRYGIERAGEMRVLATRGVESESEIPFSGLSDLVRPVLDRLQRIPPPQAAALAGALALGPPSPGDRFAISAATLSLLAAAAEESPLLALVDDAHWLDASSAEALVFAARRLGAEGVVLVFAARVGEPAVFSASGMPVLELAGLDRDHSAALLTRDGRCVRPDIVDRLVRLTSGNPLALIEIPAVLSEAQLAGTEPIEEPLRAGAGIERAFMRRVAVLPGPSRQMLLVVAASQSGEMDVIVRAARAVGLEGSAALEPAEAAGLVIIDGGRLEWRHPLLRSAVYHAAPPGDRRAVHRAYAEVLTATRSGDRRAWHLAAATVEPDEDVAALLEEAALEARRRNAPAAAARAFERAARLSPTAPGRVRRLFEAARDAYLVGHLNQAIGWLDEVLATNPDPIHRADVQLLRSRIEMWSVNPRHAHALLLEEATRVEPVDPGRAVMMLGESSVISSMMGDVPATAATAARALAIAGDSPPSIRSVAEVLNFNGLVLSGEARVAHPTLTRLRAFFQDAPFELLTNPILIQALGHSSLWVEDYAQADQAVRQAVETARAANAIALLPFPLAVQSELHYRTGRWSAARAEAAEAARLATETGQLNVLGFSLVCLAQVDASQGRGEDCRANVARAVELATQLGVHSLLVYAGAALGLLALGLGRIEEAIVHLEEVARLVEEYRLGEPGAVQWAPDLIEAYARAGRARDAGAALARFEREAEHTGRNWALATAARGHGLLAPDADFERWFGQALDRHRLTPTPFESARTELCLGERMRRAGRDDEATPVLRSALSTFEHLDAAPWARAARRELRASGAEVPSAVASTLGRMTPQELQVALMVAQGASNKEVAAALFLSTKTIEFHLGNIYRKLGLRSRAALASLVARDSELPAIRTHQRDFESAGTH